MPRTLPTGMIAELQKSSNLAPIALVDIQLADGVTNYYWSDVGGSFPVKVGAGPNALYSAWIKSVGPFRISRSLRTDGGELKLQNLSGNTIDRDVAALLKAKEFEGALCVVRIWHILLAAVVFEFQGFLTDQVSAESEVSFKILQLLDPSGMEAPVRSYSAQCTFRYKSAECGSASGLSACPKDFASCQTRTAVERFNGIVTIPRVLPFVPNKHPHHPREDEFRWRHSRGMRYFW